MNKKFTLLLLGPAGSGKSAFVSGLSKLDIFDYVTAKTQGGANTTKIATIYEFNNRCNELSVVDCMSTEYGQQENLLLELQNLSKQKDGLKKLFEKINDNKFSKQCSNVTIQLPCKENLIPENALFDSIVVRDSRGFGDVDDKYDVNVDDLGVTYDVNAILFFSISSIQQPAIFSKIIRKIMEFNLKTPMFLLRRDADLTQNDVDFENEILNNISDTDEDLIRAIKEIGKSNTEYRINNLVFNIPEVKMWKGALNIDYAETQTQISHYSAALEEILEYATDMYEILYRILVEKMQGKYQNEFVNKVLNHLLSEKSFDIVANITEYPHSKPGKDYYNFRDTAALANPVLLFNSNNVGEQPFEYERSKRGNQYIDGIIPSYSYSCVNFRNVFRTIVRSLVVNYRLVPLFSTFMDIILKDYTVSTYTGYTFENSRQDAFKFNQFLIVRDKCTKILLKNNLVENNNVWKRFLYTANGKSYDGNKAIAVLVYKSLVDSFNLLNSFNKYQELTIKDESIAFVEKNKKDEIFEQLKRK